MGRVDGGQGDKLKKFQKLLTSVTNRYSKRDVDCWLINSFYSGPHELLRVEDINRLTAAKNIYLVFGAFVKGEQFLGNEMLIIAMGNAFISLQIRPLSTVKSNCSSRNPVLVLVFNKIVYLRQ